MKDLIKGAIVIVIGGTIYSVSQGDIVKNFSEDTGLSQTEAEQYVENIAEDELASFDEIGTEFIIEGQEILSMASEIDCVNYTYDWESTTLSCAEGKSQLRKFGNDEIALGKAYKKLDTDSATTEDIAATIRLIDVFNGDFSLGIIIKFLDYQTRDELKKTNSYNKALLQSVLDSE